MSNTKKINKIWIALIGGEESLIFPPAGPSEISTEHLNYEEQK